MKERLQASAEDERTAPAQGAITATIEGMRSVAELEDAWRDLESRADTPFFLSWHWIGCWLECTGLRPAVLIARRDGDVVGLGLLHPRTERRHKVFRVRTLHLNQTGADEDVITIEFNGFLADRGCAASVRKACLECVLRHDRLGGARWDELALRGIVGELQPELEATGFRCRLTAYAPSAYVDLDAVRASGKPFLQHVSSNTRRQIRKSVSLYEVRGPLRAEAARDVAEALAFFEQAGILHQKRWVAKGKPGAFSYPFFLSFHRALIERCLPEGAVELVRVTAGDEPIGYLYNFVYRGRVYYYFSGLRFESDNRLKPGLVSHYLAIQRHLNAGAQVYDFMAGDNRYKTSLGKPGPDMIAMVIAQPRWKLRAEDGLRFVKNTVLDRFQR